MLSTNIKRLLYPLYIYPRTTAAAQRKIHALYNEYRTGKVVGKPSKEKQLKVFSSLEEDGIIVWLMASLGIEKGNFLDIGSNDCINSNCANLAFNFGWDGTFVDADARLLKIGERNYRLFGKTQKQRLKFVQSFLYPHNINEVVSANMLAGDIDFMSIDIDGDDYSVWKALDAVRPKVVVVENKIEYGWHDIVVPASEHFQQSEWGASLGSVNKLAETKGYTLVAVNDNGFNAFFMRSDVLGSCKSVRPLSVESVVKSETVSSSFYPDSTMVRLKQRVEEAAVQNPV